MKHTLVALGCALALAGGNALAGQDTAKSPSAPHTESSPSSSGGGFVEKTKEAFHKLGQSVKSGFHKAEDKTGTAKSDNDSTRSMGAGPSSTERDKRMDSAYDDYKNKSSADKAKSSK